MMTDAEPERVHEFAELTLVPESRPVTGSARPIVRCQLERLRNKTVTTSFWGFRG